MSFREQVVMLVNINIGLWFGGIYVYLFNIFRHGGIAGESSKTLAYIELFIAILCFLWFICCTVWVLRKSNKLEKVKETSSEDSMFPEK